MLNTITVAAAIAIGVASTPPPSDYAKFDAWLACVRGNAAQWASLSERPETIAAGALGACLDKEQDARTELAGDLLHASPGSAATLDQDVDKIFEKQREVERERLIAIVLARRAKP